MKECHIFSGGSKHTLTPPTYLQGVKRIQTSMRNPTRTYNLLGQKQRPVSRYVGIYYTCSVVTRSTCSKLPADSSRSCRCAGHGDLRTSSPLLCCETRTWPFCTINKLTATPNTKTTVHRLFLFFRFLMRICHLHYYTAR